MGRIKERAKRIASSRGGRMAGAGLMRLGAVVPCTAIGGGAQYGGQFAGDKLAFVREKWWGEGVVLLGGAVVMQRRGRREVACALAGAAGYSLAQRKKFQDIIDGKGGANPVPTFPRTGTPQQALPPATTTTSGIHDAAGIHAAF